MNCIYYRVGRVPIAITSYGKTIDFIHGCLSRNENGYVCVMNMRTVTLGNKDDAYFRVTENSLLNVPDGTPLVWCGRWWGIKDVERVCGPVLFNRMLRDHEHGFKHFFLGDTEETLAALTKKAQEIDCADVTGSYSPPFKPLEEYDLQDLAKRINDSGANIVWTSLRAPKQDYLGELLSPLLKEGTVMIGVGAAFRAYIGELSIVEGGVLQKMGLGGWKMLRKGSSILKEIGWYIKHSFILMGYFILIKWRQLSGKKCFEL